jgi:hypothetical protein
MRIIKRIFEVNEFDYKPKLDQTIDEEVQQAKANFFDNEKDSIDELLILIDELLMSIDV